MEQITPLGQHCILELYGCPPDLLNDVQHVREAIAEASRRGLSTLLELSSHRFYPQGVTAVALLAESHLSIHTWPECGYAAVDIFTCGETADPRRACDYLLEQFAAGRHSMLVLPRGGELSRCTAAGPREPSPARALCPART